MESDADIGPVEEKQNTPPLDWTQPQFILMMAISVGLLAILVNYGVPPLILSQLPLGIFLFLAFAATVGVACFATGIAQVLWRCRQQGRQKLRELQGKMAPSLVGAPVSARSDRAVVETVLFRLEGNPTRASDETREQVPL